MFGNNVSKKEIYKKISNISPNDLKKIKLTYDEIEYLKNKILNNKFGLILNFEERDEFLENNYFGLEEEKSLSIINNVINSTENDINRKSHLLIEGDNYYGLKALFASDLRVNLIYIDPPYNTGNKDFIYNDKYVSSDDEYKHSKWLSFMKKRLELAKCLLDDNGLIYISIDDNEQSYLKILMDEIFGESNFISSMVWDKRNAQNDNKTIERNHEYILMYAKDINKFSINRKYQINKNFGKTYSLTIGASGGGVINRSSKFGLNIIL